MPSVSFFCLIALTRTCNTILNKRGEGRLPCLVPDLREKLSFFSDLNTLLAEGIQNGNEKVKL